MSEFYFRNRHTGAAAQNTNTIQADTWREVADTFYEFLLGCGFQLTRDHLSDHFLSPEYARILQEVTEAVDEDEDGPKQAKEDKEEALEEDEDVSSFPKCNCKVCTYKSVETKPTWGQGDSVPGRTIP